MKHWSALNTGLMPAEFTNVVGENGLLGSGSIGGTFGGCCEHVSQEPSSSETRSRLSLNSAVSFSFSPDTGFGTGDCGLGRGPGSCALKMLRLFWPTRMMLAANANMAVKVSNLTKLPFIFDSFCRRTSHCRTSSV